MDVTNILAPLNEAQMDAVTASTRAALVLAGAGSGKTRVLVHRIAWVLSTEPIEPGNILAVTFTNKAANEMRWRIQRLLDAPLNDMWVGTFHGLAHQLLRRHYKEAELPKSFQILDSDDQLRVIKRLLRSLEVDETKWPPKQIQWFINSQKEEGLRAESLHETRDPFAKQMASIYMAYQLICERSGVVDFAELLLRSLELMRKNKQLRDHYINRFKHVLVDEFQDTNRVQYAWLRLLSEDSENLFVVGDDDQSIYSWRGARVENLTKFQKDYPSHTFVRLEQNYRSTAHILAAANELISRNTNRLGKNLWTHGNQGEPIALYRAFNEQDEAYFVADRIREWSAKGHNRKDIAILYRSNAQSRQFEEKLIGMGIPYRVYGGLRFFERAEIKDALAYLRIVSNRDDDGSFERVINTPTRGIGPKTLDILRTTARQGDCSLWQAARQLILKSDIPNRIRAPIANFIELIDQLDKTTDGNGLSEQTSKIIESVKLRDFYQRESGPQSEQRLENLDELISAARQFESESNQNEELGDLTNQFLAHAVLESGDNQAELSEDYVQLMTLHAAKGLEFGLVFLVGMEEGLFPSQQSIDDSNKLEEERRLCYVGITRAKKTLFLTYAETRRIYGKENYPSPSRFIRELPEKNLIEVRARGGSVNNNVFSEPPLSNYSTAPHHFNLGQSVHHQKFGNGIILKCEGEGNQSRVQISFNEAGIKWLMLAYANLRPL